MRVKIVMGTAILACCGIVTGQSLTFYFSETGNPAQDCVPNTAFASQVLTLGTYMKATAATPPCQGYQVAFQVDKCAAEISNIAVPAALSGVLGQSAGWVPAFWFAEVAPQAPAPAGCQAARASAIFDFSQANLTIPSVTLQSGVETSTFRLTMGPELAQGGTVTLSFTNTWDWGLGGDPFNNLTVHNGQQVLANPLHNCQITIQGPIVTAGQPDACFDICQDSVTVTWTIANYAAAQPYLDPTFGIVLHYRYYDINGALVGNEGTCKLPVNQGANFRWTEANCPGLKLSACSPVTVLVFWIEYQVLCAPNGPPGQCATLMRTDVCSLERRPHILASLVPDNMAYWHPITQLTVKGQFGFLEHCDSVVDCGYCAKPSFWCLGRTFYHSSLWKIRVQCGDFSFIYHGLFQNDQGNQALHADTEFLDVFTAQIASVPPFPTAQPNQVTYAKLPATDGPRILRVSLVLLQPKPDQADYTQFASYTQACETASLPFVVGFRRGDTNQNELLNIADVITMLNMLFCSGFRCADPVCEIDANNDNALSIADPVYVLNFLFRNGPEPPVPFDNTPGAAGGTSVFGIDAGAMPSARIPISCGCRCACTTVDSSPGCSCAALSTEQRAILVSPDSPGTIPQCP
jgi:hypothetical protein